MDIPNINIVFDPTIKQFDHSSLKMNILPRKCDKLVENFIEELNSIDELKYFNKHQFLYLLAILALITVPFAFFSNVALVAFSCLLFLIICWFVWIFVKYRIANRSISKTVSEYKISLRKFYSVRCHFKFKFRLRALERESFKFAIELKNLKKSNFLVVDNYPDSQQ